jgi:exonuclease SbcC
MFIKSLTLKNIRSYTRQTINLPAGSLVLAGDIGSGKSSILHSIEFALFGARRDSLSGEALLRKGCDEGSVELTFSLDNKEIKIKRGLKRSSAGVIQTPGFIEIEGSRLNGMPTELKAAILSMLGYPKELLTKSNQLIYRYTVYTPQEEMKQILTEANDQRTETLRKVFGIDKYKRIAENAATYIKRMREFRRELQGITTGLDEKKNELSAVNEENNSVEEVKKEILPLLHAIREKKSNTKEELTLLDEKIKKLNEFRKSSEVCDARLLEIIKNRSQNKAELEATENIIAALRSKLNVIFFEEKRYPEICDVEVELAKKENELKEISARKSTLSERQKQVQKRISEIDNESENRKNKAAAEPEKEKQYNTLLEEIKDKEIISGFIRELDVKVKEIQNRITENSVKKNNSYLIKEKITALKKCPTCMQEVSEFHKEQIILEETEKISAFESELEYLTGERQKLTGLFEEYNKKSDLLNKKEKELAALSVEISNLKRIREDIAETEILKLKLAEEKNTIFAELQKTDENAIKKIEAEVLEKKALLREIHEYELRLKEKKHNLTMLVEKEEQKRKINEKQEKLKQEVAELNNEKIRINKIISSLQDTEKMFENKKKEFDALIEEEKSAEIRLGELNKELEGLKKQIIILKKDIAEKEEAKRYSNYLADVQEWIEKKFISAVNAIEKQVMARIYSQFSELFSEWFELLLEDENITVRLDETFLPVVSQNGYDISLEHLSGGEKNSVALAYRLALNKVINDMMSNIKTKNLLILDEPTDGFSTEQLDRVKAVLDELKIRQTIIVSHESKIESFVDHVIRIEKDEHISRIVS